MLANTVRDWLGRLRPRAAQARQVAAFACAAERILTDPADRRRFDRDQRDTGSGPVDFVCGGLADAGDPGHVFERLRWGGQLTWAAFWESLISATRTTCMIGLIIVAAAVLASACAFLGIPRVLAEWVAGMQLGYYGFLLVLLAFYIILGCFLDGFSVILLTGAVIMPLVQQQGIDPIWFGIFITLAIEMSQITPPVGFNLYVLQGLTGKDMLEIAAAAFPFFLILVFSAIILMIFPGIVHILL